MAAAVTTAGSVTCPHKGAVTPFETDAKLTVARQPVALERQVEAWTIVGCTQTGSPPTPCTKVAKVEAGLAAKLLVGGSAVVLDSLKGLTNGNPAGNLGATAGQAKLTAS
jgi:hypothetical protein